MNSFAIFRLKLFVKDVLNIGSFGTGTNNPQILSELQQVGEINYGEDDFGNKYHRVKLTPARSLVYNECDVLHTKAIVENDDAKPFLAQYVKEPIRFINFKIELYHASDLYACEAKITRKPIDKPNANEQHIASVKFDYPTKSFTYTIIEPEAGFVYKINWEKPSL